MADWLTKALGLTDETPTANVFGIVEKASKLNDTLQDNTLKAQQVAAQEAYQQASIDVERKRLALQKEKFDQGKALLSGAGGIGKLSGNAALQRQTAAQVIIDSGFEQVADDKGNQVIRVNPQKLKAAQDAHAARFTNGAITDFEKLDGKQKQAFVDERVSLIGSEDKNGITADYVNFFRSSFPNYAAIKKPEDKGAMGWVQDLAASFLGGVIGSGTGLAYIGGVGAEKLGDIVGAGRDNAVANTLKKIAKATDEAAQATDKFKTAEGQRSAREMKSALNDAAMYWEKDDPRWAEKVADAIKADVWGFAGNTFGSLFGVGLATKAGTWAVKAATPSRLLSKVDDILAPSQAAVDKGVGSIGQRALIGTVEKIPTAITEAASSAGEIGMKIGEEAEKRGREKGLKGEALLDYIANMRAEAMGQGGIAALGITLLVPGSAGEKFFSQPLTSMAKKRIKDLAEQPGVIARVASRGGKTVAQAFGESLEESAVGGFTGGKTTAYNMLKIFEGEGSDFLSFSAPDAAMGAAGGALGGGVAGVLTNRSKYIRNVDGETNDTPAKPQPLTPLQESLKDVSASDIVPDFRAAAVKVKRSDGTFTPPKNQAEFEEAVDTISGHAAFKQKFLSDDQTKQEQARQEAIANYVSAIKANNPAFDPNDETELISIATAKVNESISKLAESHTDDLLSREDAAKLAQGVSRMMRTGKKSADEQAIDGVTDNQLPPNLAKAKADLFKLQQNLDTAANKLLYSSDGMTSRYVTADAASLLKSQMSDVTTQREKYFTELNKLGAAQVVKEVDSASFDGLLALSEADGLTGKKATERLEKMTANKEQLVSDLTAQYSSKATDFTQGANDVAALNAVNAAKAEIDKRLASNTAISSKAGADKLTQSQNAQRAANDIYVDTLTKFIGDIAGNYSKIGANATKAQLESAINVLNAANLKLQKGTAGQEGAELGLQNNSIATALTTAQERLASIKAEERKATEESKAAAQEQKTQDKGDAAAQKAQEQEASNKATIDLGLSFASESEAKEFNASEVKDSYKNIAVKSLNAAAKKLNEAEITSPQVAANVSAQIERISAAIEKFSPKTESKAKDAGSDTAAAKGKSQKEATLAELQAELAKRNSAASQSSNSNQESQNSQNSDSADATSATTQEAPAQTTSNESTALDDRPLAEIEGAFKGTAEWSAGEVNIPVTVTGRTGVFDGEGVSRLEISYADGNGGQVTNVVLPNELTNLKEQNSTNSDSTVDAGQGGVNAVADVERVLDAKRNNDNENVPSPEAFGLVGSNRPADVGAAAGQSSLLDEQAPAPAAKADSQQARSVKVGQSLALTNNTAKSLSVGDLVKLGNDSVVELRAMYGRDIYATEKKEGAQYGALVVVPYGSTIEVVGTPLTVAPLEGEFIPAPKSTDIVSVKKAQPVEIEQAVEKLLPDARPETLQNVLLANNTITDAEVSLLQAALGTSTPAETIVVATQEATVAAQDLSGAYIKKFATDVRKVIEKIIASIVAGVTVVNLAFTAPFVESKQVSYRYQQKGFTEKTVLANVPAQMSKASDQAKKMFAVINASFEAGRNANGWMLVDKPTATAYVFDKNGAYVSSTGVLLGATVGDSITNRAALEAAQKIATPNTFYKTYPVNQKITQAGIFTVARELYGVSDNAIGDADDTPSFTLKESRTVGADMAVHSTERSFDTKNKRRSYGCINAPESFLFNVADKHLGAKSIIAVSPDVASNVDAVLAGTLDIGSDSKTAKAADTLIDVVPKTTEFETTKTVNKLIDERPSGDKAPAKDNAPAQRTAAARKQRQPDDDVQQQRGIVGDKPLPAKELASHIQEKVASITKSDGKLKNLEIITSDQLADLIKNDARFSEVDSKTNGFYDPETGKFYLISDQIAENDAWGTLLHEVFHKQGEKVVGGKRNYEMLVDAIESWKSKPKYSAEYVIGTAASKRAREVAGNNEALYKAELVNYAITEAAGYGIEAKSIGVGKIEGFLHFVKEQFAKWFNSVVGGSVKGKDFSVADLMQMAHAALTIEQQGVDGVRGSDVMQQRRAQVDAVRGVEAMRDAVRGVASKDSLDVATKTSKTNALRLLVNGLVSQEGATRVLDNDSNGLLGGITKKINDLYSLMDGQKKKLLKLGDDPVSRLLGLDFDRRKQMMNVYTQAQFIDGGYDPRKPSRNADTAKVRVQFNALDLEQKRIYVDLVDALKSMNNGYRAKAVELIERSGGSQEFKSQMQSVIAKTLEGYGPLTRHGDYTVVARDKDGDVIYFRRYVGRIEAEGARARLDADPKYKGKVEKVGLYSTGKESFIGQTGGMLSVLLNNVQSLEADESTKIAMRDMLVEAHLRHGFGMKNRAERKGVAGGEVTVEGLQQAFNQFAGATSSIEYQTKIQAEIQKAGEFVKARSKENGHIDRQAYLDAVTSNFNFNFGERKGESKITDEVVALSYLWSIAYSIAAAAVNVTQLVTGTVPSLMAEADRAGMSKFTVGRLLSQAMADVTKAAAAGESKMSADVKRVFDYAIARGKMADQELNEANRIATSGGAVRQAVNEIYSAGGFMQNATEKFNVGSTMLAAYRFHKMAYPKASDDTALEFAHDTVRETQFNSAGWNKALKLKDNTWGRIFGVLRTYPINLVTYQYAQATSKDPIERRKFYYQMGMMSLLGGVGAHPVINAALVGAAMLFGGGGTEEEERELTVEQKIQKRINGAFGLDGGAVVSKGLLAMANVNIAESIKQDWRTVFRKSDAETSAGALVDYGLQSFGPFGSFIMEASKTTGRQGTDETLRQAQALSPRFAKGFFKTARAYSDGGLILTKSGDVLGEPSAMDGALTLAGFQPLSLSMNSDAYYAGKKIEDARKQASQEINVYARAIQEKDGTLSSENEEKIKAKIEERNKRFGGTELAYSDVVKSLDKRAEKKEKYMEAEGKAIERTLSQLDPSIRELALSWLGLEEE